MSVSARLVAARPRLRGNTARLSRGPDTQNTPALLSSRYAFRNYRFRPKRDGQQRQQGAVTTKYDPTLRLLPPLNINTNCWTEKTQASLSGIGKIKL